LRKSRGNKGDRDPINAGSVGEAVGRGGSMAAVEMSANPFGAHQVGQHITDHEAIRIANSLVKKEACLGRS
jgi:hypothetical protein